MGKVLLLFALLLGSLCLLGAGLEAHRLRWEATWPTTVGVVNDSRLFEGDESAWVEVRYTYEVGGARITKTGNVDIPNTRAIPDGYRPETEVTVHYHPTIPDRSYLRHAGYSSPIALAVMGAVVWLVCLPFVAWQMLMWHVDRNVPVCRRPLARSRSASRKAR